MLTSALLTAEILAWHIPEIIATTTIQPNPHPHAHNDLPNLPTGLAPPQPHPAALPLLLPRPPKRNPHHRRLDTSSTPNRRTSRNINLIRATHQRPAHALSSSGTRQSRQSRREEVHAADQKLRAGGYAAQGPQLREDEI